MYVEPPAYSGGYGYRGGYGYNPYGMGGQSIHDVVGGATIADLH